MTSRPGISAGLSITISMIVLVFGYLIAFVISGRVSEDADTIPYTVLYVLVFFLFLWVGTRVSRLQNDHQRSRLMNSVLSDRQDRFEEIFKTQEEMIEALRAELDQKPRDVIVPFDPPNDKE